MNMGGSTYHITDNVPDVKALALALFRQAGLRGVANVEFKMDDRDGKLKLIECNARFTAADCLLVASGLNLSLFVYDRLTGRATAAQSSQYRLGMRLWKPIADVAAYRELNRMGLLTFGEWIRSILHPQVYPVFRWNDPLPSLRRGARLMHYVWSRLRVTNRSKKDDASQLSPLSHSLTTSNGVADHVQTVPTNLPRPEASGRLS
jgi:D-aspartate ligase